MKKFRIALFIVAVAFVLLFLWNAACKVLDKESLKNAYGQAVSVNNLSMNVLIQEKSDSPTIVILPGMGSSSPAMEFLPMAYSLSQRYQVIIIEPFGYGLSDMTKAERKIENVVSELHDCIQALKSKYEFNDFYLMAHSLGGIYSLFYANQYPGEVKGFIGIDASVPGQLEITRPSMKYLAIESISLLANKALLNFGILRILSIKDKSVALNRDREFDYSEKQTDVFRILTLDKTLNRCVRNEMKWVESNLKTVDKMKFPSSIPVLQFVSAVNSRQFEKWETLHNDVIANSKDSSVILIEGPHYLHLTNKADLVDNIFAFVSQ